MISITLLLLRVFTDALESVELDICKVLLLISADYQLTQLLFYIGSIV